MSSEKTDYSAFYCVLILASTTSLIILAILYFFCCTKASKNLIEVVSQSNTNMQTELVQRQTKHIHENPLQALNLDSIQKGQDCKFFRSVARIFQFEEI